MTKIYNIRIMTDPKDINKNPALGESSASSSKGKQVVRMSELETEKELLKVKKDISIQIQLKNLDKEGREKEVESFTCAECGEKKEIYYTGFFTKKIGTYYPYEYNGKSFCRWCWNGYSDEKLWIDSKQKLIKEKQKNEIAINECEKILKGKNNKLAVMVKIIEQLKEQSEAEKEERERKAKEEEGKREAEKEREAEIARLQGEDQKALLSSEKKEIEQLRAERNQLRNTTEEQEAFLTRWVKEYERLELDKSVAVHTVLKYDTIIKQRDSEIRTQNLDLEQLRSDKIAISADNTGYKEEINNLNKDIKEAKDIITELESNKVNLEAKVTDLEIEKKDWKEKYEKEKRQKRIGMIGNIAQGAVEWLPIPEKWQGGLKTSIQAASVWALWKDLPNWTYEGLIMLVGVGLWYAMIYALRKVNRFIFGRKDKKQVSNLEQALTNIIEGGKIGKEKKTVKAPSSEEKTPTIIIQNSPPVISNEGESKKENLTQISNEKTELKNQKKNGSTKKKKIKKKVKGDSG